MITCDQIMENWMKQLLLQRACLKTNHLNVELCSLWISQGFFFIFGTLYSRDPSPALYR